MLRNQMATRTTATVTSVQSRSTKPAVNLGLSVLLLASTILFVQANDTTRPVIPITIPSALLHFSPSSLLTEPPSTPIITAPVASTITATQPAIQQKIIAVKSGQSLATIFNHNKISAKDLQKIMSLGKAVIALKHLKPNQTLTFTLNDKGALQQLVLQLTTTEFLTIIRDGNTFHVQTTATATPPVHAIKTTKDIHDKKIDAPNDNGLQFVTTTIKHSLSAAARQAGLSNKLTAQLNTIFSSKIDVHAGDTIKALYQTHNKDGHKTSDIVAAEITHKGKTYKAIRFTDPQGRTNYYSPDGKSFSKVAFTRYPVNFTRISSIFSNMRWHPLLHMYRKHTGVDYAAPSGAPIKAAGDGKVSFVGTENGYGRAVIIRHNNEITTLYGHMSRYAKGITAGKMVKLGQIIGYVGSSGLASGPHLHFEYRINNVPVNPLKVALPDAPPLSAKYMRDFLAQTRSVLAQLDSHSQLAMK